MKIVLFSDDISLLSYWDKAIADSCKIVDSFEELFTIGNSLIIMNFTACKGYLEEFFKLKAANNSILVLNRTPTLSNAKELLRMGVNGYGNALMKEHFLLSAIDAIRENMVWLHPEFTSMLIHEFPSSKEKDITSLLENLSKREQEVALFLKDGLTYKEIANTLEITPRTVKAHANNIYTKLQVKDRLALALLLK